MFPEQEKIFALPSIVKIKGNNLQLAKYVKTTPKKGKIKGSK